MLGLNSTLGFLLSWGLFTSDTPKIIGVTEFGKLEGKSSVGRDGRTIYEFVGLNYANPPLGDLRFRPPVAWNKSWDGVRDATNYGPKCKQFHLIGKFITGSEDCLYLNVYTHQYQKADEIPLEEDDLTPVIVYFHGGLFMHGSGEWYKPKYMLDSDIVLVTINYRVGAFGFLNLGAEGINGNMGLKDQVEALKWIQRNIRNFGGNPNLVTIMGESAGAACVHYHLLSPKSRGLFHRAISQSGNALVTWASQDNPEEQAFRFAAQMNCMKSSNKTKIAKCLRNADADKIAKSQRSASDILHHKHALYSPTIEKEGEDAFISALPQDIIKAGNITKVPWLVGVNSEEGLIYSAPILRNETIRSELNKNWTLWAPSLFRFDDEPNKDEIAEQIRTYYLGNASAEISMATLHNITTFLSDRSFFEGLHNSLLLHRGQHPVYPYVYAYEGKFSFAKVLFGMTFALPAAADVVVSRSWKWFLSNVLGRPETSYGR
ncbi:unnamed protein product [Orchesella dallaii]|uniref:Carboxylic ester hydrolase n=1 Tax=Orchesella dallaii TaxID=48710 RepID=A0ABP1PX30_9HEXA